MSGEENARGRNAEKGRGQTTRGGVEKRRREVKRGESVGQGVEIATPHANYSPFIRIRTLTFIKIRAHSLK